MQIDTSKNSGTDKVGKPIGHQVPGREPLAESSTGKTTISDTVVSTIARLAASHVDGVHKLGAAGLRGVFGRMGKNGVDSEVGMKEAAVSLELVIEYGYSIREVAQALRERVIDAVELMAGRKVVAVDIHVTDVHIQEDRGTSRILE